MSDNQKKTIFSGVQPSGKLTLGNYLGAIRNFPILQEQYNCIYCVVDQHAITVRQEPAALRRATLELIAQYIACGLDPKKNIMFIQSHVPAHAELSWVLGCFVPGVTAVGGEGVLIKLADGLKPEHSNSFSGSVDWTANIGHWQTNLLLEAFYTGLDDVFVLEKIGQDEQGN